jgi:polysaccharide export outer membrane protein
MQPLLTRMLVVCLCFGSGWLAGCGGAAHTPPAQLAAQLQAQQRQNPMQEKLLAQMAQASLKGNQDYAVGPEDLLQVVFFGAGELDRQVRVNGLGEITLPLVGPVQVGGQSPQAIERRLAQLYREGDFLKEPQISVEVKEYRHQRVMVTGAVVSPGSLELIGPRTLLEILGKAGGLTDKAGERVHIIRAQSAPEAQPNLKGKTLHSFSPGSETIVVDLKRLVVQGAMELNLPIKNGDIIHVPFAKNAYVLGAVMRPGSVPVKDGLTAAQAVALAGGKHALLASDQVTIVRLNDRGEITTLSLDLGRVTAGQEADIPLKENDIVTVQESGIRRFFFDFRNLMPGSYSMGAPFLF